MTVENFKYVYLELLQDMLNDARHQERLQQVYTKARANLEAADGTFHHPKDLKKVKGIGEKTVMALERRLEKFCRENGKEFPKYVIPDTRRGSTPKRTVTALQSDNNNKTKDDEPVRKKRKYIPKKKSGGYAILLGLLELNAVRRPVTKDEIITTCQKFASSSMSSNPSSGEFYGAWSSISSLLKNSLVLEEGRPKRYSLTTEGVELAKTLKSTGNIIFDNEKHNNQGREISLDLDNERTMNLSELLRNEQGIRKFNESSFASALSNISQESNRSMHMSTPQRRIPLQSTPRSTQPNSIDINDTHMDSPTSRIHMNRKRFGGVSYEIWPNGSYEIRPMIDHREVKSRQDREFFTEGMERKGIQMETRQLALGDILWVAIHKKTKFCCVLNTIIERKRLDDLAASIKDNRFMEQKNRLEKSVCSKKYYLIEETMQSSVVNMAEVLKTALWMILIYYRFSVIRSVNSTDTVDKLSVLHSVVKHHYHNKDLLVMYPKMLKDQNEYTKILKNFQMEFSNKTSLECCHTINTFQEIMGKNDSPTIGELTIQILMYVKGVSLEKAVAIQSVFPTLNHILTAYRNCSSELEAKMLMFQKLGDAPGNKKITKSLSGKISEAFI
ncbi:Crossover junction endonuclease mus81 [Maudiozyma exigua]|uniref:Crossover junction endonuclease MUS81 n=1 Tax=Maudiozyma exigua TaxID=34358 RepID=A0A9P6VSK3_MAUEX|nr:Crossover junction endonuclease mus81 [Kazachstania exigua]